jgi:hypothetical protein
LRPINHLYARSLRLLPTRAGSKQHRAVPGVLVSVDFQFREDGEEFVKRISV